MLRASPFLAPLMGSRSLRTATGAHNRLVESDRQAVRPGGHSLSLNPSPPPWRRSSAVRPPPPRVLTGVPSSCALRPRLPHPPCPALSPLEQIDALPADLYVTIERGTDLAAADVNGKSDPYVVYYVGARPKSLKHASKTQVKKATLNPGTPCARAWCADVTR